MKYQKSWTEALLEVQDITEDVKMGKQSDDQLKKIYKTASEKDQSSPANKSFTQRVAKEMKKRGISEQEGVRKVDFVDGISPELQEAKPEFEVKYATSKKGPIKVTKFMSLDKAKEFLDQVKKHGSNGIISKGGKPIKEAHTECPKCKGEGCEHCDGKGYHEEVKVDENPALVGAAIAAAQKALEKAKKENKKNLNNEATLGKGRLLTKKEREGLDKDDEDPNQTPSGHSKKPSKKVAYDEKKMKALAKKDKMIAKMMKTSPAKTVFNSEVLGDSSMERKYQAEETINESDYELYHKDFSSAMQHAYAHAKKKGFIVDPQEIDDKVATGPKKPSKGKTNRYILGTDKKKKVHIQVANLDNKKYELNMYIEETEKENMDINETIRQVLEAKKMKKGKPSQQEIDKNTDAEDDYRMAKLRPSKYKIHKEDSDKSEPGTQGDDKEYQKKRDAILKKYGVESCAMCKTDAEKKACFNELDKAHVGDHEESTKKEATDDPEYSPDNTAKKMKKAKEPQESWNAPVDKAPKTIYPKKKKVNADTLLDKVKNLMKEKKYKK